MILLALKEEPVQVMICLWKEAASGSQEPQAYSCKELSSDQGSELLHETPAPVATRRALNREPSHIMARFLIHRHCERIKGSSFQQQSLW